MLISFEEYCQKYIALQEVIIIGVENVRNFEYDGLLPSLASKSNLLFTVSCCVHETAL